MKKADFNAGIIFILVALVFFLGALRMPLDSQYGWYGYPGFVPAFLSAILFLLGLALLIRSWPKKGQSWLSLRKLLSWDIDRIELKRFLITLGFCLTYVALLGRIHYILASFLFLIAFMTYFLRQQYLRITIIAAVAGTAIFFVFTRLFYIVLP